MAQILNLLRTFTGTSSCGISGRGRAASSYASQFNVMISGEIASFVFPSWILDADCAILVNKYLRVIVSDLEGRRIGIGKTERQN